ncbi:hypothetical protein ACJMK2_005638 [Sinanodonta woodiana]|uniref:Peptidase M12B domain-containing protein n=1 Tax=Sinanodonta woodiana TaxID=1069815 RepID=A0ABD3VTU2_SINWO
MPQKKKFMFLLNGEEIELDLQLNNIARDDTSVHVTENGILKLIDIPKDDTEMFGFYQDPKTNAAVMVNCDKLGSICQLVGTFMLNGQKYRLEPSGDRSEATHFVTEIRQDDKDSDMYGDSQQIPDLPSSAPRYRNLNTVYSTDDKRGRIKRTIPAGVDIIELYIYTDESIYQRFLALYGNMTTALAKIQQYYSVIGNEMDLEYQQVKSANTLGIDIRIYLKGVRVALVASDAPWSSPAVDSTGKLNSSKALNDFSTWQKNYQIANNLQYDLALAVTALCIAGKTWFSAVCFSDSFYHASIIEDRGCRLALTAVHELGHFLAANHDPTNGSCSYGYIMAPSFYTANATTASIQHTFSSCSISSMTSFLYNLGELIYVTGELYARRRRDAMGPFAKCLIIPHVRR